MKKIFYTSRLALLATVLVLFIPGFALSQMFSVEEPERRARVSTSALLTGLEYVDMRLRTDPDGSPPVYSISDPVYKAILTLPGIELYGAYRSGLGDSDIGADTLTYMNLGANVFGSMPVYQTRRVGLFVPLMLSTDFLGIRSTRSQPEAEQFRESSASIGFGFGGDVNVFNRVRLRLQTIPKIGFTVSSVGRDSGQITSLNSNIRLSSDRILGRLGLAAGYGYSWRRYSGSDPAFRYDITTHSILVGISF